MSVQTRKCFCSEQVHANPWRSCLGKPSATLAVFTPEGRRVVALQWQREKGRVGSRIFAQSPFYNKHVFTQAERSHVLWGENSHPKFLPLSQKCWKGVNVSWGPLAAAATLLPACGSLGRLRPSWWTLLGKTDGSGDFIAIRRESSYDRYLQEATSCRLS